MKRAILGVGSPFGEDRVGWVVIDKIEQQLSQTKKANPDVVIEKCDRPGLSLIEKIKTVDHLIMIDAVKSQHEHGKIHELSLADLSTQTLFSTHGFGVANALALADALNLLPQKTIIYGIEIRELNLNTQLNSTLEKSCGALATKILSSHFFP